MALSKGSGIRHNSLNPGSVILFLGKLFYFLFPEMGMHTRLPLKVRTRDNVYKMP